MTPDKLEILVYSCSIALFVGIVVFVAVFKYLYARKGELMKTNL